MAMIVASHDRFHTDQRKKHITRAFVLHLAVYLLVSGLLIVLNLATARSSGTFWFQWPVLGWGIGIAIHGLVTHWARNDVEERYAYHQRQGSDPAAS